MIEETSKEAKQDILGLPNDETLKHSFRNLDTVNEIGRVSFCDARVGDQKYKLYKSTSDLSKEITKTRTLVRQDKYFENAKI